MDAYVRHPAVVGDVLLLVADDDVWIAPLAGGRAHRLTDGRTPASLPVPSADGALLAYTGRDSQHPEAFVMPLEGGPATRTTHLGATTTATRAWHPDGSLVVATTHGLPFDRDSQLLAVDVSPTGGGLAAGAVRPLGWGSAHEVAFGPGGRVLLGRHTTNQGRWKRYRGGLAGQLWVDPDGGGAFRRLLGDLPGDIGAPMLLGDRAWFISDHEGVGNLCSCDLDGGDLQVHTRHEDYYARFASTDGRTIVWSSGGDVWAMAVEELVPRRVDVRIGSPRVQRAPTVVDPARWLQSYALHPRGTHLALRIRGKAFALPLHDGPPVQHGERQGVGHRLLDWLPDGDRLVVVSDAAGEERLEVHGPAGLEQRLDVDLGHVLELVPSPVHDRVAVTDQEGRLRVIDLGDGTVVDVAVCPYGVDDPAWSPDGRWLAWSHRESNWYTASIRVVRLPSPAAPDPDPVGGISPAEGADPTRSEPDGTRLGPVLSVTDGRAAHRSPHWSVDGRLLLWVAGTRFVPVADGAYFDHAFVHPDVVMAAVLRADDPHPLHRDPRPPGTPPPRPASGPGPGPPGPRPGEAAEEAEEDASPSRALPPGARRERPRRPPPAVRVDAEGLADRVVPLPLPTGRYRAAWGLEGSVLALAAPLRPPPAPGVRPPDEPPPAGQLETLDLDTGRHEVIVPGVSSATVSADGRSMAYQVRRRLRVAKAGAKPPEGPAAEGPPRVSGWVDLSRLSVHVDPPAEWRQILGEAWRLQRDLFWHRDMSGVDWPAVRARYAALVDRIASRAELSDLIWEMFGELGTGHAYERGGDHPATPQMPIGHLGADLAWTGGAWVVERVLRADPTDPSVRRPLRTPGSVVAEGAEVLAIDGVAVDAATSPASLLVDRADKQVRLRVADPEPRDVVVRTLRSDAGLRYADWVERNRAAVAERSGGRAGYVHIPDMGARGYAAFHRQYLAAAEADALVVDVRFNGGGNVSSLLLEKLAGRRIGYQVRRTGALEPYPHHAPSGPLVAITNERCGSDGDIFTHAWRRLDLGPVVGTRTWGGVIGIQPRHTAADGTVTTQPGFAFWFDDVGWAVENRGVDPTHPVEIAPHDAAAGRDPQLETAVDLVLTALDDRPPPPLPDITTAPDLGAR